MSNKSAIIQSFITSFDEIKIDNIAKPVALPGTVVIKVKVAASNPVDTYVAKGYLKFWSIKFPFTLGYDLAGVVDSVGDGVTEFAVGENVFTVNWGVGSHSGDNIPVIGGAFAEYAIVRSDLVSKLPDGISFKEGAALALVGLTAYQGLVTLEVTAGKKVLILGGSTAVGLIAIQLAKIHGATVYTTASSRTINFVKSYTATEKVINYTEVEWENDPDVQGVDAVYDTVGQSGTFEKAKKIIKPGGKFITIANQEAGNDPLAHPPLSYASFFCLSGSGQDLKYLIKLVKEGKLKVKIDEEFPFTEQGIKDLLTKASGGKSIGKNILIVS